MEYPVIFSRLREIENNGVRSIINDWTLQGLNRTSFWVDVDDLGDIFEISSAGIRKLRVNDWVTAFGSSDQVRAFVLQNLNSKIAIQIQELRNNLQSVQLLAESLLRPVNVVVPGVEHKQIQNQFLTKNVVNALVDLNSSSAPKSSSVGISARSDVFFSHVAANLASIAGLWSGLRNSPLPKTAGEMKETHLTKSYVRYVDASELVDEVVGAVLSDTQSGGRTIFDASGSKLDALDGAVANSVVNKLSTAFLDKNKQLFELYEPRPFRGSMKKGATLGQTIREFLRMSKDLVFGSLESFISGMVDSLKVRVAENANRYWYGDKSEREIVFAGVRGGGAQSVTAESSGDAARALLDVATANLAQMQNIVPAPKDPVDAWQDFADLASSLLDAGRVSGPFPMPEEAGTGKKRVLPSATMILADPGSEPHTIPSNLEIPSAGQLLRSDDPYAAKLAMGQLDEALARAASDPRKKSALLDAQAKLTHWITKQNSFAWRVGEEIAQRYNIARLRWRDALSAPEFVIDEESLAQKAKEARSAFRRLLWVMLGIFAAAGLGWLGQALSLLLLTGKWPTVFNTALFIPYILITSVVIIIWNLVAWSALYAKLRDYFRKLHEKDELLERQIHRESQILELATNVYNLGFAYIQYQAWVRILSQLIHRPFGEISDSGLKSDKKQLRFADLPPAVQIAKLDTKVEAKDELLQSVKMRFYRPGWLGDLISEVLDSYTEIPGTIWRDPAKGSDSKLEQIWLDITKGSSRGTVQEAAANRARELAIGSSNYQAWMVSDASNRNSISGNCQDFLAELLPDQEFLSADLLTPSAQGASNRVDFQMSKLFYDERLDASSSKIVSKEKIDREIMPPAQRLDFLVARVEISSPFKFPDLTGYSSGEPESTDDGPIIQSPIG